MLCLLSLIASGTRRTEQRTIYENDYTLLSSLNCIHEVPWLNAAFSISMQSNFLSLSSTHSRFRKTNNEFANKNNEIVDCMFCKIDRQIDRSSLYFISHIFGIGHQVTKCLLSSDHCRNPQHGVLQLSGIYRLQ